MKKLFKLMTIALVGSLVFTSCKDNDLDLETGKEANLKAEKKLDSLFSAEKIKIEKYVTDNFTNAIEDTVSVSYQYLGKKIKRGLWYEILSAPTDDSFEYTGKFVSSYYGSYFTANLPKVKLKYTAKLLDGTVVQQESEGSLFDLSTMSATTYNNVWEMSFVPYSIKYNGNTQITNGLTAKGLKKGSKIRVISPSYWAFYNKSTDKIPAYSPLVYEFEILSIEY